MCQKVGGFDTLSGNISCRLLVRNSLQILCIIVTFTWHLINSIRVKSGVWISTMLCITVYLGFIFDPALKFPLHIDWWVNKAHSTLRAMKMLGNSVWGLTPSNKRQMYLTAVLPVLTYGFQLWYRPGAKKCKQHCKWLELVQHKAARWITGGFKMSPLRTTGGFGTHVG